MQVILNSKFYGNCPGLKRSLRIAERLILKADGDHIFYDVPLAHNTEVQKSLDGKGFQQIKIENYDGKSGNFLVSAHGASPQKIKMLEKAGFKITDATCPTVARLHKIAAADYQAGYDIVIFGKARHPEVEGVNGCSNNRAIIVSSIEEAKDLKLKGKTSVICQTTFSNQEFHEAISIIKENNPQVEVVVRETACPVVEGRIRDIIDFVKENKVDFAVVVGSSTSSNTKQLAHKLEEIVRTKMLNDETEVNETDFRDVKKVLVVSGTSALPDVVERVYRKLKQFA